LKLVNLQVWIKTASVLHRACCWGDKPHVVK